jgi:hypothetical protein
MRALLVGFGVALAMAAGSDARGSAYKPVSVQFGCDGQAGTTCYFSLVNHRGVRSFTLPAGSRKMVGFVTVGQSFYVSIGDPNGGDDATCQRLVAQGKFCQLHLVRLGYNH